MSAATIEMANAAIERPNDAPLLLLEQQLAMARWLFTPACERACGGGGTCVASARRAFRALRLITRSRQGAVQADGWLPICV